MYSIESVADVTDLRIRVHVDAHSHSPDLGDAGGLARSVVPASAGLTVVTSGIPSTSCRLCRYPGTIPHSDPESHQLQQAHAKPQAHGRHYEEDDCGDFF